MKINLKKFHTTLILIVLFISSYSFGYFYGSYSMNQFFNERLSLVNFIFRPSGNIIKTYILLNSSDELKRLEGYYSYRELPLRDENFLLKRYSMETSDLIKKTIIWVAEEKFKDKNPVDIYQKFYNTSSENLKIYLQQKIDGYNLDKAIKK